MVKAEIKGFEVTFDGQEWTAADADLKADLEFYATLYAITPAAGGSDPDPVLSTVNFVISKLGGAVISADIDDLDPLAVY